MSDVSKEMTAKIELSYEEVFDEEKSFTESLIDKKLKANEQRRIEKQLMERVESFESKLEAVSNFDQDETLRS